MAEISERPNLTLSIAELQEITGAKQVSRQRRALIGLGLPFRESPAGLLVSRSAAEDWLRCNGSPTAGRPGGPRFDLVR